MKIFAFIFSVEIIKYRWFDCCNFNCLKLLEAICMWLRFLVFNLFSSFQLPEAISCGFLLVVCEEDIVLFLLTPPKRFRVAFCFLCVEKQGVLLYSMCFHRF